MKGRKQKISQGSCLEKVRAELGGYQEVQTFMWITENNWIYRSYCATCTGHVVPLKTDVISRPNLHINL